LLETNDDERGSADRDCLAPQRIHVRHGPSARGAPAHAASCLRQRATTPGRSRVAGAGLVIARTGNSAADGRGGNLKRGSVVILPAAITIGIVLVARPLNGNQNLGHVAFADAGSHAESGIGHGPPGANSTYLQNSTEAPKMNAVESFGIPSRNGILQPAPGSIPLRSCPRPASHFGCDCYRRPEHKESSGIPRNPQESFSPPPAHPDWSR
jgi:hypothetical protein